MEGITDLDVRKYRRREVNVVPAVQITTHNIVGLENFYNTSFVIGEYLIMPDELDDTAKVSRRKASIWNRGSFERTFEEVR